MDVFLFAGYSSNILFDLWRSGKHSCISSQFAWYLGKLSSSGPGVAIVHDDLDYDVDNPQFTDRQSCCGYFGMLFSDQ